MAQGVIFSQSAVPTLPHMEDCAQDLPVPGGEGSEEGGREGGEGGKEE